MISRSAEVLLWAQRVISRRGEPAHVILDVHEDATPGEAQAAFHKIARSAHPDLHRSALSVEELELVTSAYAQIAGAYQTIRTQTQLSQRMRPVTKPDEAPARPITPPRATPVTPSGPATPSGPTPGPTASGSMSAKALIYWRKAELCLRRGDLKGAVLQIKLAIAADSQSSFLRTALAEVELEVRKST